MNLVRSLAMLMAVTGACLSMPARALTLDFFCITDNAAAECAAGEAQIHVEAYDAGGGQVGFLFTNVGAQASSITDVYFDDGTLLGISQVVNGSPGVDFSPLANPGNLPGGSGISPAFATTAGFSADSNPSVQPNGVNPGESLTILFYLQAGGRFTDIEQELASGELRVGVHAQGFASGGSASFVNLAPVPVPAAGWLLLTGLVGMGLRTRRRRG